MIGVTKMQVQCGFEIKCSKSNIEIIKLHRNAIKEFVDCHARLAERDGHNLQNEETK